MELIFNELSAIPAPSRLAAREVMSNFVGVLTAATRIGFERTFRSCIDFSNHLLSEEYPVVRWRNDPDVERDEKAFFRLVTARFPIHEGDQALADELLGTEYFYNTRPCVGLGVADVLDTISISLAVADDWATDRVIIDRSSLNPQTEEIDIFSAVVNHASSGVHIGALEPWIVSRNRTVESAADLIDRRNQLFPNLEFCERVSEDLLHLGGGALFSQTVRRLFELDDFCVNWADGPFVPRNISGNPREESAATLQQFSGERTFRCPDGQARVFSWHVSLPPSGTRLYFYPIPDNHSIFIGYVGTHLRTARYR